MSCSTRLEPYELLELVGQGGMGEVPRRFAREAHAARALSHPLLCTPYIGDDRVPGPSGATRSPQSEARSPQPAVRSPQPAARSPQPRPGYRTASQVACAGWTGYVGLAFLPRSEL